MKKHDWETRPRIDMTPCNNVHHWLCNSCYTARLINAIGKQKRKLSGKTWTQKTVLQSTESSLANLVDPVNGSGLTQWIFTSILQFPKLYEFRTIIFTKKLVKLAKVTSAVVNALFSIHEFFRSGSTFQIKICLTVNSVL